MTHPISRPISHPSWCDPRVCELNSGAPHDVLHGGTPVVYRSRRASAGRLTAHLIQMHDYGCGPESLNVCLAVEDMEDMCGGEPDRLREAAAIWVDSNDLRIIAAVLTGFADKIDGADR